MGSAGRPLASLLVPWAIPVAALLLSGSFCGCYLSHEIGGGSPPPAMDGGRPDVGPPPRPDAGGGGGDYWALERRDARLSIPHQLGCTQYEGGRVALEVRVPIDSECEHSGPVDVEVAADGSLRITAYLWVHHTGAPEACLGTTALSERTLLWPLREGTFRAVTDDGGSSVELSVGAIDDRPCSFTGDRDAPCVADCDCAGELVCIPQLGDFVMCSGGHCGDPCNRQANGLEPIYGQDLECEPTERCLPGLAGGALSCQPIEREGCDPGPGGEACGPGLLCPPTGVATECIWDLRLSSVSRHLCEEDADCDAGLLCVQHREGERRCEVPCFSNEMRCPIMHACTPERWVCEWLGE